jgi:hypothetical protein
VLSAGVGGGGWWRFVIGGLGSSSVLPLCVLQLQCGHGGAYRWQRRCVASVAEARCWQPAGRSACPCYVDSPVHGCAGSGTMQRMRQNSAGVDRMECRRLRIAGAYQHLLNLFYFQYAADTYWSHILRISVS